MTTTNPPSESAAAASTVATAAERLWVSMETRTPCAPVRDLVGAADTALAYAVQQRIVARLVEERGWRPSGRKLGLTNPAVQRQFGVDQPDYGTLFAQLTYGHGEPVPSGDLLQPRVEAEVAFVLDDDLVMDHPTVSDVIRATAYAVPALEIVDSRIAGWDLTITDTIADNASHGAMVLGTAPVPLDRVDVRAVRMRMEADGQEVSTGSGADCLGNPLVAAAWLAARMVERQTPLRAGDVVLTGSLGPVTDATPGMAVTAELTGLGTVSTVIAK